MVDSILSGIFGSGITLAVLLVLLWLSKNFVTQYLNNYIGHEFTKRTTVFKAVIQEKQQEQQNFHELLIKTIFEENKEVRARKIAAADSLWQSLLAMKKFSIVVKFLGTLNFEEIQKRATDPKIQKFLNSFPQCSFAELHKKSDATKDTPPEVSRLWVTHRAWSLYLAYNTIIYYAIYQFENAKIGGNLGKVFDESKMLEVLQNALPEITITQIFPALLGQMHDLIEFSLLTELKASLESKEDSAAIARAQAISIIATEVKNEIKLTDIN